MKLNTKRCIIRKLQETDFNEAINLFTDEDVRCYLGGTIDINSALEKLNLWINKKNDLYLIVRTIDTQAFVGIISITDHHDGCYKELSYQFLTEFWGKGIATECIAAVLEFLKNETDIVELIAETQSRNYYSCKLLEKLGFGLEDTVVRFGETQRIYKLTLDDQVV